MTMAIFTIRGSVWIAAIALSIGLWASIGYAVKRGKDYLDPAAGSHRALRVAVPSWRSPLPGRIIAR